MRTLQVITRRAFLVLRHPTNTTLGIIVTCDILGFVVLTIVGARRTRHVVVVGAVNSVELT